MKRQLALLRYALGALERRARRSLALVVGLAFTVALFGSVWMLSEALRGELGALADQVPDLTVQRLRAGRPGLLQESEASELRSLPAVAAVQPRVWGYVYLGVLDANLTVVGAEPAQVRELIESGRVELAPGAEGPPSATHMWLGRELARSLEIGLGDKFALPGGDGPEVREVGGLFDDASALRTADVVLVDVPTARLLLGLEPGEATDFAVTLSQPREAPIVAAKIRQALAGRERVLEKAQLERAYGQSFGTRSGLMMAGLLPALASLLLIAFDRLTGLAEEERREIGVLRASGFLTADILAVRMWESLWIALAGTLLGLILAYGFVFGLDAPLLRQVLLGYSTLYPALSLTPQFDVGQAFAIVALVCVPFTAVSLVPAWRAAVLDPALSMRGAE